MKRTLLCLCAGCAFLCLTGVPRAQGWGCRGHEVIAYLAEKHLTPEAKVMVVSLLSDNPVQYNAYCGTPTGDLLADASTWADGQREKDPSTAPWHYIDIPRGEKSGEVKKFCGAEGCITQAIEDQLAILKNKDAPGAQRAAALRFVIHLVGDLHQPLHTISNGDRGGNCVPVKYFDLEPHRNHYSYSPNLHEIWDSGILEKDMQGLDSARFADVLEAAYSSSFAHWQAGGVQVEKWAWESHRSARRKVYGALPQKIPIEPEGAVESCSANNHVGERMLTKNIVLDSNYQAKAAKVVEKRLAKAGIRVALILNEVAQSMP